MTEGVQRDDWTLGELLDAWGDSQSNELGVAGPGRVESYDAVHQIADVTPVVRRTLLTEEGEPVYEDLPTIRAVRVLWPRAGNWCLTAPLEAGHFVTLLICDRDISRFLQTGQISNAPDRRMHHLQNAVCMPVGPYPRSAELQAVATDALELGNDSSGVKIRITAGGEVHVVGDTVRLGSAGASDAVALSSLVDGELTKIATTLASLVGGSSPPASFGTLYDRAGVGSSKVIAE